MKALDEAEFTIVGTGLMGTSLALALRHQAKHLTGVDAHPTHLNAAAPFFDSVTGDLCAAVPTADVVILAAPIRAILALIVEIEPLLKPGALVIDLGSVKTPIMIALDTLPEHVTAIGGHPMCGKELSGPTAADAAIYRNCRFVLCPSRRTTTEALAFAQNMVAAIGAHPVVMDALQHDRAVAAISHLPYLVSAGLVGAVSQLVRDNDDDSPWRLAASGFRDTSRLAASDVTMMGDTVLGNRPALLDALDAFAAQIRALRKMLATGDESQLRATLEAIQKTRLAWLTYQEQP